MGLSEKISPRWFSAGSNDALRDLIRSRKFPAMFNCREEVVPYSCKNHIPGLIPYP
jgi:hypothetical protein